MVAERDGVAVHREEVGVDGHRQEDGGEDREDFHRESELIGEEGIVGLLQ